MKKKTLFLAAVVDRRLQAQVEVWRGLCEEAQACDWPWPIEEVHVHHRQLDTKACMGLLSWIGSVIPEQPSVPVINLSNAKGPLPDCGNLLNADESIGCLAAEHLLHNGYREYLALSAQDTVYAKQRIAGFSREIRRRNLPVRTVSLPKSRDGAGNDGWNPQNFLDETAELLAPFLKHLPPDAGIFAVDHPAAQHVEHCLFRHFPERTHTTGLIAGDLPVKYRWLPGERRSISCVQTANAAKGRAAMRWFHQYGRDLEAVRDLCERFEPTGILIRASTAGPACGHPVLAKGLRWSWSEIQRGRPPNVGELAARLGMSARSLNRLFRDELQQSARDFLLTLRMERAAQVLRTFPERPIQHISDEAGFSNQGTFASAFRAWSGLKPSEYREDSTDRPPGA